MKPFLLANFKTQYHEDDTWHGFTIKGFCVNNLGQRVTNVHPPKIKLAYMQFRTKRGSVAYELCSDTAVVNGLPAGYPYQNKGTITIEDTDDWYISVNAQPLNLNPGVYDWELQLQDCNNAIFTLLRGELTVVKDVAVLPYQYRTI